jgi:hypothetical protein
MVNSLDWFAGLWAAFNSFVYDLTVSIPANKTVFCSFPILTRA